MTVSDFLTLATHVTIILIALVTLLAFLRQRDQTRLDITLTFVSLALVILTVRARDAGYLPDAHWLITLAQLLLIAHPFLLLRLVHHFRPVYRPLWWLAVGGLLLSWLVLLVAPAPLPLPLVLALVAYFICIEGYAVLAFILGARVTSGVTHWRLLLVATASALLALVLFIAGVNAALPALREVTTPLSQTLTLLSMLCYFAGFAPPQWLRKTWQYGELHDFLRQAARPWTGARGTDTLDHLCAAAARATGASAALTALWDDEQKRLVVAASTEPTALPEGMILAAARLDQAWRRREPVLLHVGSGQPPVETPLLVADVQTVLAVPIATKEYGWGLLVVFIRRLPLFPADDLDLLALFAEQTAVALSYTSLLDDQENLIQRLRRRTRQLEAANKELEAFSYSVSHDLRAPLRHIAGYVEMLQKHNTTALDEKGQRYLNVIWKAANQMGTLIDDLLAFSRIGRIALHKTHFNLQLLVVEAIDQIKSDAGDRDVVWRVDALPEIYADRTLLRLALVNLIANALKFTRPRAQARIEVGCANGQHEIVCFVRDNGVGFDMNYAGKLFGVFQRLHSANEFEGTGIGLANVHRIISRHGGRVWVESAVDEGATFYFSLPPKEALFQDDAITQEDDLFTEVSILEEGLLPQEGVLFQVEPGIRKRGGYKEDGRDKANSPGRG